MSKRMDISMYVCMHMITIGVRPFASRRYSRIAYPLGFNNCFNKASPKISSDLLLSNLMRINPLNTPTSLSPMMLPFFPRNNLYVSKGVVSAFV